MTSEQFGGIMRAILTTVAGYAAGKGLISTGIANELVGAGVTICVAVWSAWTNKKPAA